MKKLLFVICIISLLCFSGCSKKRALNRGLTIDSGVLKVGMEIGYPPFEYYDSDGKTPIGFDVELGKELARRLGLERAEFIDTAWDGILTGLDTKKYDCIISAMTITDERKENYDFTREYIGNCQSIVILKTSSLKINSPRDLANLKVGYQAETTSDLFMEQQAKILGFSFKRAGYEQVLNAFDDLLSGEIDAVCTDSLVSIDYISKPDTPYVIAWQGEAEEYFGICIKKGKSELREKCTKALDDMFADGTLVQISKKIFGQDVVSVLNR